MQQGLAGSQRLFLGGLLDRAETAYLERQRCDGYRGLEPGCVDARQQRVDVLFVGRDRGAFAAYEQEIDLLLAGVDATRLETAVAIASLPLGVRGFGPVKQAAEEQALQNRESLMQRWSSGEAALGIHKP